MDRHYYTVKMRVADVRDTGEFDGYASVFNELIECYNEMVDPGAYKKTLSENGGKVSVLYMHDSYSGRPPIGLGQSATEDLHGLAVSAKLSIETHAIAKETWGYMKLVHEADRKIGLSVGFQPMQMETDDKQVNHVKEARLFEYSITPPDWQAGPSAGVNEMRSAYNLAQVRFTIQLLQDLGVSIPNATQLDEYLADNGDGHGSTEADIEAPALEPDESTQAATNEAESRMLHSLIDTATTVANKL